MKIIQPDDQKSLREFGLVLAVMFPLIFAGLLPWLFSHARPVWPLYAGGVFLVAALAVPLVLYPVYVVWMRIARVLGFFTNTIILGLAFFLVLVPLGLILRKLGKLQYREGFEAEATTYRISQRREFKADDLDNPF